MAKRKSSSKKYHLYDDPNFILIAGGGFVVIVLMFMVTGNLGFMSSRRNTQAMASQKVERFIGIENSTISPKIIHVNIGTTVTWTNKDLALHTVAADDGSFNTGNLHQGESGSVSFAKIGTFQYKDLLNPEIQGTIIVE